jgi:Fe-S cluster biosynthesis and repair protein YggX
MSKTVFCKKCQQELPALQFAPLPGALGEQIVNEISQQGWELWLGHQTMLINEYRLNLTDAASREFLQAEMKKFLFEGGSDKPEGFVPE